MRRVVALLGLALALGAPAAAAQAPAAAPDVVLLKDGAMLRGTIAELVPGDHVVIVLITGKTREVPWDQVEYGGPADRAPSPSAPTTPESPAPGPQPPAEPPTPEPTTEAPAEPKPRAEAAPPPAPTPGPGGMDATSSLSPGYVSFRSADDQRVTFHIRTGSASGGGAITTGTGSGYVGVHIESWRRLCTAPCETELQPGEYKLGLSVAGEDVRGADDAVLLEGPTQVTGEYVSRRGRRIGAWVFLGVTSVVGISLIGASVSGGPTYSYVGIGVATGGALFSLVIWARDKAIITASPMGGSLALTRPAISGRAAALDRTSMPSWTGGLALTLTHR